MINVLDTTSKNPSGGLNYLENTYSLFSSVIIVRTVSYTWKRHYENKTKNNNKNNYKKHEKPSKPPSAVHGRLSFSPKTCTKVITYIFKIVEL